MKEIQLQTPQRDPASANRRPKSAADLNKNLRKVSKMRLSSAFKAASEEGHAVLESLKEVSDDDTVAESDEFQNVCTAFLFSELHALVDPVGTPSSESVAISALTSPTLSSFSAVTNTNCENPEADFFDEIKSIETDVAIKHLREARIQVLKSKDVGSSKKILDALINVVIEEFYCGAREENGRIDKVLYRKANVVFLSLLMGIYAILVVWLFKSDVRGFRTMGHQHDVLLARI